MAFANDFLLFSPLCSAQNMKYPIDFVEIGVATFSAISSDEKKYRVAEPLVWEALFTLLRQPDKKHREYLGKLILLCLTKVDKQDFVTVTPSFKGICAERAMALIFWYMDKPGRHLVHFADKCEKAEAATALSYERRPQW